MKFALSFFMFSITILLSAQSNPRSLYEKELADLVYDVYEETGATFEKGPIFYFEYPYKALFKNAGDFPYFKDLNSNTETFSEGDTVILIGAAPIGKLQLFKRKDREDVYKTKIIGRPGFEIIESERFELQMTKIKGSNWRRLELLSNMLGCGSLDKYNKPNFEKHFINFGDTPIFFQVRLENNRVLLYFMLKTYSGNDFKEVGVSEGGKSKIDITFTDGTLRSFLCEGKGGNETFAIIDITDNEAEFLLGVERVTFYLSKKEVNQQLFNEDKFSIGLKMECMESHHIKGKP